MAAAPELDLIDVCRILDGLVGANAEMTLEWFSTPFDNTSDLAVGEVAVGHAEWDEAKPNCAPVFIHVGKAGMPVAGHGFAGGERVPGGVSWRHMLGRVTIVAKPG